MNRIRNFPFALLIILALILFAGVRPAAAGDGGPGNPSDLPERMHPDRRTPQQQSPVGGVPDLARSPAAASETGGPDWYGYTWDDSVALNWIDAASGGTDVGLGEQNEYDLSDPINLPFPFRFYEEVYSQIWVAPYGYLNFDEDYYVDDQQDPFPDIQRPTD